MTVNRLAVARNRRSVPRKPRYFSGWGRPTSSICVSMLVTIISSRFCQRDRFELRGEVARDELRADDQHEHQSPREHDGPVELEEPVLPEDHLIGAKVHGPPPAMPVGRLAGASAASRRARHDESNETREQPLQMTAGDDIESGQGNAHPQQHSCRGTTAPAGWPRRPCEPSTTGRRRRSRRARFRPAHASTSVERFIHRRPRPSPCLPWRPNATH